MPADPMPAAEVSVDEPLVRALLRQQLPQLAGLPLRLLTRGWDNVIFRLGDDLVVRLPHRQLAAALLEHEQRWLPVLAPSLPVPVPTPVHAGRPGAGYPWAWSVCPWFPGSAAAEVPAADPAASAEALGRFLEALHRPAPDDAPANPYRGGPLSSRDVIVQRWLGLLTGEIDTAAVAHQWQRALDVPPWTGPPLWLHGDLHPFNLVVHGGRLSAVIDFGDITAGDPATDLATAWLSMPADVRPVFRRACGDVDDATWERARAWALLLGLAMLATSADSPRFARLGAAVVTKLVEERR